MTPTSSLFYSISEFLELIKEGKVKAEDFKTISGQFSLAKPKDIYEVSFACGWVGLSELGFCIVTEKGKGIIKFDKYQEQLRQQLLDYIHIYAPPWAIACRWGRGQGIKSSPQSVIQIFKEAELLDSIHDDVVGWWDQIGAHANYLEAQTALETGRKAERLSFEFEKTRTGKEPIWISIETDFAGFDISSVHSKEDETIKRIEVKGTLRKIKNAKFKVSRHQWNTAITNKNYEFHLWALSNGTPIHKIVGFEDVAKHIPTDNSKGEWKVVEIPFGAFS